MKSLTQKFSLLRAARLLALPLALLAGSVTNVTGQTTTFAQYLSTFGGQDYVFTNGATSGTFQTISGGAPVDFRYLNVGGLPPSLSGFQSAHVFISSTTTQSGSSGGGTVTQPFNSVITIQIIRDTPAPVGTGTGSRTNLLTVVITPAAGTPTLSGADGGNSATLSATTPAGTAHSVTFSSHFLNFGATTDRNAGLSFSSVSPNYSLGAGNFLSSMTAAGTGTFASNPVPTYGAPTASDVSVGGRVFAPSGRALSNALVTLQEENGTIRTTRTSSFGFFRFEGLRNGQTVLVSVGSKRYAYDPQLVSLLDNALELSFTPLQ